MTLDRKKTDIITQLGAKGIVGAFPFVGPLVAEVMDVLIPNQRVDRIVAFLQALDKKVTHIELDILNRELTKPEGTDLFEDCLHHASRAFSEGRQEQIAALFKNSLTDQELEHIHYKKLLSILGELSDLEILLLKYHSHTTIPDQNRFWDDHKAALEYAIATMGTPRDEVQPMIDKEAIHGSYSTALINKGLVEAQYASRPSGNSEPVSYNVTHLGNLLLRSIDEMIGDSTPLWSGSAPETTKEGAGGIVGGE